MLHRRRRAHRLLVPAATIVAFAALVAVAAASRTGISDNEIAVTLGKSGELSLRTDTKSASAGEIGFVVRNKGKREHEFVILRTKTPAARLTPDPDEPQTVVEKGWQAEIESVAPGRTVTLGLSLKKGHYVLLCNLDGHYAGGMRADLVLR